MEAVFVSLDEMFADDHADTEWEKDAGRHRAPGDEGGDADE